MRGCPPLRSDCGAGVPPVKARRVKVSVQRRKRLALAPSRLCAIAFPEDR
ncbi:hypothetical protein H6G17_10800 [Chroococcidiopsis sp. FACHB-1243]|nr:hypothetical protein [Chroococcidiopsis sp. [FACHB-1243]]MBD2306000.1 hypothetical protein [Chroococcidiopsis sp. [FACHB-1243]]